MCVSVCAHTCKNMNACKPMHTQFHTHVGVGEGHAAGSQGTGGARPPALRPRLGLPLGGGGGRAGAKDRVSQRGAAPSASAAEEP